MSATGSTTGKAPADPKTELEVLLFDVFGTVTDWKGSMTRRCERFGQEHGVSADWEALVTEWRSNYQPAIAPVRDGARPWADFDTLQREMLDALLPKYKLDHLSSEDRQVLVHGWHRTEPWPDVLPALQQLGKRYILAPLSNGTVRQLLDTAKHAGLPWDTIFGADMFRTYKPAPKLYEEALALVGSPAARVVMVAAHNNDLQAARQAGMRTAFIHRATEDPAPEADYDYVARDLADLAQQLQA